MPDPIRHPWIAGTGLRIKFRNDSPGGRNDTHGRNDTRGCNDTHGCNDTTDGA